MAPAQIKKKEKKNPLSITLQNSSTMSLPDCQKTIYLLVILLGWSLGPLHLSTHRASSSFGHGLSLIRCLEGLLSHCELPLGSAKPVP